MQELLPPDIQAQFGASRELIRNIYSSFHKLRDRAERMAFRSAENATDLLLFGKELRQELRFRVFGLANMCFLKPDKGASLIY